MQLKIKRLHPDAIIPRYQTDGAACFDLHVVDVGAVPPGYSMEFRTGLSFEIPQGWAMLIYSRSGHGFKSGIRLCNSVGVIDADYRGAVGVRLHNDSNQPFTVHVGDRIAQAMLVQVPRVELVEVEELSETERGAGGFGSTGA